MTTQEIVDSVKNGEGVWMPISADYFDNPATIPRYHNDMILHLMARYGEITICADFSHHKNMERIWTDMINFYKAVWLKLKSDLAVDRKYVLFYHEDKCVGVIEEA